MAITWEGLARECVHTLANQRTLGFWPEVVGSWWQAQDQIDVVAVSYQQRIAWLREAHWRNQPMNMADLETLQQKGKRWQGHLCGLNHYSASCCKPQKNFLRPGGTIL